MIELSELPAISYRLRLKHLKALEKALAVPGNVILFHNSFEALVLRKAWDNWLGQTVIDVGKKDLPCFFLAIDHRCLKESYQYCIDEVWAEDNATLLWRRKESKEDERLIGAVRRESQA